MSLVLLTTCLFLFLFFFQGTIYYTLRQAIFSLFFQHMQVKQRSSVEKTADLEGGKKIVPEMVLLQIADGKVNEKLLY